MLWGVSEITQQEGHNSLWLFPIKPRRTSDGLYLVNCWETKSILDSYVKDTLERGEISGTSYDWLFLVQTHDQFSGELCIALWAWLLLLFTFCFIINMHWTWIHSNQKIKIQKFSWFTKHWGVIQSIVATGSKQVAAYPTIMQQLGLLPFRWDTELPSLCWGPQAPRNLDPHHLRNRSRFLVRLFLGHSLLRQQEESMGFRRRMLKDSYGKQQ